MTKIEKAMNDAHPDKNDYVWEKNGIYTKGCIKIKCVGTVVMKRSVSDGWHVGICGLCHTKNIQKDSDFKTVFMPMPMGGAEVKNGKFL